MMRRWWWTLLGWLVGGAAQAVVAAGPFELPGERVLVRLGPNRQVEVVTQCVIEFRGGDPLPPLLIYAVPSDGLEVAWLPGAMAWPDPEPRPLVRRPWMVTTTPLFLQIMGDPPPPTEPAAEAPYAVAPPATAAEALSLEALLKRDREQQEAYRLTADQLTWAKQQAATGRRFVMVPMATSTEGLQSPALQLRYRADPPVIPFSTAPAPAATGFEAQSRYQLFMLADTRMQPTYADGYPPFPDLALKCAEPNPAWLGAVGPAKYATYYDANVPTAARSEDLVLKPAEGAPIPPPAQRTVDYPRPVPVDVIAASALLAALIQWQRRRRRTAGTTSSAT